MAEQPDLFTDSFSGTGSVALPRKPAASGVLTFGKHRGQPYEVLLQDSAYALWLMSSMPDKLANNHQELWAFLVRRYGMPDRTPEHNKLQNRFLSDDFCLRFAHVVRRMVQQWAKTPNCSAIDLPALWKTHCAKVKAFESNTSKLNQSLVHQAQHLRLLDACGKEVEGEDCPITGVHALEFESEGADVRFRVMHGYELETTEHPKRVQFGGSGYVHVSGQRDYDECRVEVKPVVGDDYPAILRAMKAVGSRQLLVGEYSGAGATWAEVVKVFSLSKISAVLLAEVEASSLPLSLAPVRVVPLSREQAEAIALAACE